MGSALWVMDYLSELSQHGVLGANFHGGPMAPYDPISYEQAIGAPPIVRPMYYGMWMFSELVAGAAQWHEVSLRRHGFPLKGGNSAVHVASSNGTLRVLVIAKEVGAHEKNPIKVSVSIPAAVMRPGNASAMLFRLQSVKGGLLAKDGLRFAEQTFDGSLDGLPAGERKGEVIPMHSQQASVEVGPFVVQAASAVLVTIAG